jgi:putative endonuclease
VWDVRQYFVYILASRSRQLYVGVTNNLAVRLAQHRLAETGFTAKYRVCRLVHFETTTDVNAAIAREKQIKGFRREKKIALIKAMNPAWNDLAEGLGLAAQELTADSSLRSE